MFAYEMINLASIGNSGFNFLLENFARYYSVEI